MDRDSLLSRFTGLIHGLAIGDALAKPTTGLSPYEIMCRYQIMDAFYPDNYDGPGKNSPIAKNAFIVLKSIFENGKIVQEDIKPKLFEEKNNQPSFLTRILPLAGFLSFTPIDDITIIKECKDLVFTTHQDRNFVLPAFAIAKCAIDCIRNRKSLDNPNDLFQKDLSLMSRIINTIQAMEKTLKTKPDFLFSDRLAFTRRKLQSRVSIEEFLGINGNTTANECACFSLFCFMKSPDSFKTICTAASMGGSANVNASLVGGLVGGYSGGICFQEDLRDNVESSSKLSTMVENLIDKFFKEDNES